MKFTLSNALTFIVGAAIGSIVTWKFVEEKYKKIADEEIASVKEVFSKRNNSITVGQVAVKEKPTLEEMAELLKQQGYTDYSTAVNEKNKQSENKEKGGSDMTKKPYVITPEDFGWEDGYDTISLTYYADGVLTDDFDEVVEDIDKLVGEDSLTHFGEYEDDSVFVRNEVLKTDYEILRDLSNYSDEHPTQPVNE